MKQGKNAEIEKEELLTETEILREKVAWAFRAIEENAARIAFGGVVECDSSPEGWLATLAREVEAGLGPNPVYDEQRIDMLYPFPMREFPRAVEALCGLVQWTSGKQGGEVGRMVEELLEWCKAQRLDIGKGAERLRRAVAGQLAARCGTCSALAFRENAGSIGQRIMDAENEARIADAEAREENAKAEMFKAQGKADAEAAARERAEQRAQEAEAARRKAEIARARLEGRKARTQGVRGKNIPADVKKFVLDWLEREYGGNVKGEGWEQAFYTLSTSKAYTSRIRQFCEGSKKLKAIVEAARKDRKRRKLLTRGQKN